jgi:Flp pilus assembly protein TadD
MKMITTEMKDLLEHYNKGLALYKEGRFAEALVFFREAVSIQPNDGPSLMYEKRCLEFIASPPPLDWDGVYTMKTK